MKLSVLYGSEEGKKFQLSTVDDVNYRTEEDPDSVARVENSHAYEYDANGNLIYVNTGRVKSDGDTDAKTAERKLIWDEENRLLASDDNGFVTNYWYDADGERTVKTSGESDQVYVNYRASREQYQTCLNIAEAQPIITERNGVFSGGFTNTAKFSLYVSPYLVANQGGRYTKHIYIGSQRIVSKIGDFDSYGSDPRRIEYAVANTDGISVDYKRKYNDYLNKLNLKVPSGEYEGYSISFDLSFMDGGQSWEVGSKAEKDTYEGHPIGNTIRLGDERTNPNLHFEERENPDGTTSSVGGVTGSNKTIVMNKTKDTKMNRIHEIFHTFGFSHPKGSGGSQGIMKYPPSNPTKKDALELSDTDFLPTIKK